MPLNNKLRESGPMSLLSRIKRFFTKKEYKIQSFTFYIPSPPERRHGYREKQFDKVFYHFINLGYEIISTQTQANPHPGHSGMWFVCIVRAKNDEAEKLNLDNILMDEFQSENQPDFASHTGLAADADISSPQEQKTIDLGEHGLHHDHDDETLEGLYYVGREK